MSDRWNSNTDTASKRFYSRKQSNARGNSINTVKCTNVISARTLVPMCDGQDRKVGHAVTGSCRGNQGKRGFGPGWTELRGFWQKPQPSVAGIIFLCSHELMPAVTTDDWSKQTVLFVFKNHERSSCQAFGDVMGWLKFSQIIEEQR